MKNGITTILALLMIFLAFKDLLTYSNFIINRDYITAEFCVNKEKPAVMCYGKCYLESSILANKDAGQNLPNHVKEAKKQSYFIFNLDPDTGLASTKIGKNPNMPMGTPFLYSSSYLSELLRPPQLS